MAKDTFIQNENRNNRSSNGMVNNSLNANQTRTRMDSFIRSADTFIYNQFPNSRELHYKGAYQDKAFATLGVGKEEKSVEVVKWLNYSRFNLEPDPNNDSWAIIGKYQIMWWEDVYRFVKLPDPKNLRQVQILEDGVYQLISKAELQLQPDDLAVRVDIMRYRQGEAPVPLCVHHTQWGVNKTFPASFSLSNAGGNVSWSINTTVSLSLGEMHPRWTTFTEVFSDLKANDILTWRCMGFKWPPWTALDPAQYIDISDQIREFSNYWRVEWVAPLTKDTPENQKTIYPIED